MNNNSVTDDSLQQCKCIYLMFNGEEKMGKENENCVESVKKNLLAITCLR